MTSHQERGCWGPCLARANAKRCQEGEARSFAASSHGGCPASPAWAARAGLRRGRRALSSLRVREVTLGKVASVTGPGLAICSAGSEPRL